MGQFLLMSIAGSVGSIVGIALFTLFSEPGNGASFAALAGAWASLGFAAAIEWPVLVRTLASGEPLTELSKINGRVLLVSLAISVAVGLAAFNWAAG